jgi:GR25 family glycosyltransferase involved in LPS biosynthesis
MEAKERNTMRDIAIGIVADMRRQAESWDLSNKVGAELLCYDDGYLGCNANHIRVWTKMVAHDTDWIVVLEDDAVPCDGFRDRLAAALADPPADVVSLYLGRSYPKAWQRFIRSAIKRDPNAHWLMSSHVLHGVGLAIRSHLVRDMLTFVGNMAPTEAIWPVDEQITHWCRMRGYRVAYTRPSLVDHADGESLIRTRNDGDVRELPRTAWEFGSRDVWDRLSFEEIP